MNKKWNERKAKKEEPKSGMTEKDGRAEKWKERTEAAGDLRKIKKCGLTVPSQEDGEVAEVVPASAQRPSAMRVNWRGNTS